MQQPYVVIPVGTVIRLVLTTGLIIFLLILAMSTSGHSEPDSAVGAPTGSVSVEQQH
jgi:hypothetical protein